MIYYNPTMVNIVLSYAAWTVTSTLLYNKLKKPLIYALFTVALYAIPVVYFIVVKNSLVSMCALIISLLLLLYLVLPEQKLLKLVLIPLPLILCTVYELMVSAL